MLLSQKRLFFMSAEQVTVPMASLNDKKTMKPAGQGTSSGSGGIFLSLGLLGVSVAMAAVVYVQVEKLSGDIRSALAQGKSLILMNLSFHPLLQNSVF